MSEEGRCMGSLEGVASVGQARSAGIGDWRHARNRPIRKGLFREFRGMLETEFHLTATTNGVASKPKDATHLGIGLTRSRPKLPRWRLERTPAHPVPRVR